MCVIVHQAPGVELTKEKAQDMWATNPDGAGYSFVHPKKNSIVTRKSMRFQEFWQMYRSDYANFSNTDFLLHFRIATHGSVSLDNVHPFQLDEYTVVAHNGVIHGATRNTTGRVGRSDTRIFIEDLLPQLPANWLDKPFIVEMVEEYIGWSRMMFMTTNPALEYRIYTLNEDQFENDDGLWCSNTNHTMKALSSYHKTWSGTHSVDKNSYKTPSRLSLPAAGTHTPIKSAWLGDAVYWEDGEWQRLDGDKTKEADAPMAATAEKAVSRMLVDEVAKEHDLYNEELFVVYNDLIAMRESSQGLTTDITYLHQTGEFACLACDEVLDLEFGACGCWLKVCLDCMNLVGECECGNDGISFNNVWWDQLSEKFRDEVIQKAKSSERTL